MKKYHVNPETGAPGICRAKDGKCPYGGISGTENHYDTYTEAQKAQEKILSVKHVLLPESDNSRPREKQWEGINELFKTIQSRDENPEESELAIKYKIRTTSDQELLRDVINGTMYVRSGWRTIGAAIQNPNLSRKFIDNVLDNPDDYNIEVHRWLATNPALTHNDLMRIVKESNDLTTRSLALKNTSLEESFAKDFVENRKDELYRLPWFAMTDNYGLDTRKLFMDFKVNMRAKNIDSDEAELSQLNDMYKDWKLEYE